MTPISTPLKTIMYTVPSPKLMPQANAMKVTLMLLVMMKLEARGLTATTDSVHILWRSMVSIICGPRNT